LQADETLSRIKRLLPIRVKNFDWTRAQIDGKERYGLMMFCDGPKMGAPQKRSATVHVSVSFRRHCERGCVARLTRFHRPEVWAQSVSFGFRSQLC
jgi:hypothetical protein